MAMNEAERDALLATLSTESDEDVAAAAVRRCIDLLRARDLDATRAMDVSQRLVVLAREGEPRVRQAVAEASPYLPKGAFEQIMSALAKYRSRYVRDEVRRAQERYAELQRAAVPDEERDQRVSGWYATLKKLKGGAWRLAQKISAHEVEYYVRRLCHELGNTLFALEGVLKNLDDDLEAPEVDRARLREHARRVRVLVEQVRHLLKVARHHATPIEPEFRRENLHAILADLASATASAFPNHAPRIALDLSGVDPKLMADVDASFLRQALTNIVKNAIEAYDERSDGPIDVRFSTKLVSAETQVAIAVADHGCGMDAHSVRQAFVPFGSSKVGGTGFGLFIARKVARHYHGGELAISSTPGAGTVVTMTLPLRQETKPQRR